MNCLKRLFEFCSDIDVYLVDDASLDGTSDAVIQKYPQVSVIHGDGNLFWCRGMNLAWKYANNKKNYDYYVWLNDDLVLYDNSFKELLECSYLNDNRAIISGIVQGATSKKAIYGGYNKQKKVIEPTGEMQDICHLNGNFVIVPKYVFEKIGFFDPVYHHDIGDVDYGLVAIENGIKVLTTRSFIGLSEDSLKTSMRIRKSKTNVISRFRKLYSPLGCPPYISYHFRKKHYGYMDAVIYYIYLHFINILPDKAFEFLFPRYK